VTVSTLAGRDVMTALRNPKFKVLRLVGALFISALSIATSVAAQAPFDQAWKILETGASSKSVDQRIETIRVLALIPGNDKAVSIAESALQDSNDEVRGAAALTLGAMGARSAITQLWDVIKNDKEGSVVMAAAKAVIQLGDGAGYEVYYAVITGERKFG